MSEKDLMKMKKEEIFDKASKMGIFVTKRMKKGEMIESIIEEEKKIKKTKAAKKKEILKKSENKKPISSQVKKIKPPKKLSSPKIPKLPKEYGEDKLILLVRDPHWIFSYWEVTESRLKEARKHMGKELLKRSSLVIRMHDVTDIVFDGTNSNYSWDIEISGRLGGRHINIWGTDRNYLAELGYKTQSGTFIRILISNIVQVPAGKISDKTDENWMIVEETYNKLLEASGMHSTSKSSEESPSLSVRHVPGEVMGLDLSLSSESLSSWNSGSIVRKQKKNVKKSKKKK